MKPTKFFLNIFLALAVLMSSCKKDDDSTPPPDNQRAVKYEVTGNFSGKLIIVYLDNVSGNTLVRDVNYPGKRAI